MRKAGTASFGILSVSRFSMGKLLIRWILQGTKAYKAYINFIGLVWNLSNIDVDCTLADLKTRLHDRWGHHVNLTHRATE